MHGRVEEMTLKGLLDTSSFLNFVTDLLYGFGQAYFSLCFNLCVDKMEKIFAFPVLNALKSMDK